MKYAQIWNMQWKRIRIVYAVICAVFLGIFLFSPLPMTASFPVLTICAFMGGACATLANWSLPEDYLLTLPLHERTVRMASLFTPLLLVCLPSLLLVFLSLTGLRSAILGGLYGVTFVGEFRNLQTKTLLWCLLFQILLTVVLYLYRYNYKYCNWRRKAGKSIFAGVGFFLFVVSFSIGYLLLLFFLCFSSSAQLLCFSLFIFAALIFMIYLDPLRKGVLKDADLNGGAYSPDRRRLFLYALTSSVLFTAVAAVLVFKFLDSVNLKVIPNTLLVPFSFVALLFYGVRLGDIYNRYHDAGQSRAKSLLIALGAGIFPPAIPFAYLYSRRDITSFSRALRKYCLKHGVPAHGQMIDFKAVASAARKPVQTGLFFVLCAILLLYWMNVIHKLEKGGGTAKIMSNPSGVKVIFDDGKGDRFPVTTPGFVNKDAADLPFQCPGYSLVNLNRSFLASALSLEFIPDEKAEKFHQMLRELKRNGGVEEAMFRSMDDGELLLFLKYCVPSASIGPGVRWRGVSFTHQQYREIISSLFELYFERISDREAMNEIKSAMNTNGFSPFGFELDNMNPFAKEYMKQALGHFETIRTDYRNAIMFPFRFINIGTLKGKFVAMYIDFPDAELTSLAYREIGSRRYAPAYWEYLLTNVKSPEPRKRLCEYAEKRLFWRPEILALTGDPAALPLIERGIDAVSGRDSWKFSKIFQSVAENFSPGEAFVFVSEGENFQESRYEALCLLKTPEVTDFFLKRTDSVTSLLPYIAASQNQYFFPVLKKMAEENPHDFEPITSALCEYDGELTGLWIRYTEKDRDEKDKKFQETALVKNASRFLVK